MNENAKTWTFVAVAAVAVVLAWEPWARQQDEPTTANLAGTKIFPDFKDPLIAKSMDIVEYDAQTATPRPFSVAQVNGVWSIPSHQGYPADAREHLAEAATSVMGLEIIDIVGSSPGEHETYGVVDPDIKTLKPGTEGVGTRVTLKDGRGSKLADLIVGKPLKDKPELRYVRRAGQDQVFVVSMKSDKLSTKFEDWIERDLLKLNALDVRQVDMNDYSIETRLTQEGLVGVQAYRSRIKAAYDTTKSAWNLAELVLFKDAKPIPTKLGADEELNTEKLDAMKTALDDLQIVDVERKPAGLTVDLRASEEFVKNQEAADSLRERGFHPYRGADGKIDVLSTEGEVLVGMNDGIEYVLRFGEIAGTTAGKKEPASEAAKKDKPSGSQVSRYLFVTARFNEGLIEQPKLEEFKEAAPAEKPQAAGSDQPAAPKDAPGAADRPAPKTSGSGKPAAAPKRTGTTRQRSSQHVAASRMRLVSDSRTKADDPAEKPDPQATDADQDSAAAKPAGEAAAPVPSAPAAETGSDAKATSAQDQKRQEIEKENKRKQDEYDAKVKKGRERGQELNDRFAEWYYHISDDVYQKIHLGRDDVIKKKEKKAGEGDKPSDLKALDKGLDETGPDEAPSNEDAGADAEAGQQ